MSKKEKSEKSWVEKHPVWTVIIGIVVLLWLIGINSSEDNSPQEISKPKLAPLKSEVNSMGSSSIIYLVTNRNDYSWHNVSIVIDEYYTCNKLDILESGKQTSISAFNCKDNNNKVSSNIVYNGYISSMKISADEGSQYYTLQNYG